MIELDGKVWKQVEDVSTIIDDEKIASGEREYRVFYKDTPLFPKLQVFDFVLLEWGERTHFAVVTKVHESLERYEIKSHTSSAILAYNGGMVLCDNGIAYYRAVRVYRDGQKIWDVEGRV